MKVAEVVGPVKELAERRAAMAVFSFLLGGEFGEGFFDLGKEEQRVIAETVGSPRGVKDDALSLAVKCRQRVSVAGDGDDADEAAGTVFVGDIMQLAQQTGVVGLIVGVSGVFGDVMFVGGIARGADTWRAVQGVNLKARVVGDDQLAFAVMAVVFGLLASVCVESEAVFDDRGQAGEIGQGCNPD